MKKVFTVVSDLHLSDCELENRYGYIEETLDALNNIENILIDKASKYGKENCNLVLLGDVFNRSFKDHSKHLYYGGRFLQLREHVNEIYLCFGNHEFTFYKDNPIWGFFANIESNSIQNRKRQSWQPYGCVNIMRAVDILNVGFNFRLVFNHNGTGIINAPNDRINIGFFHDDICNRQIINQVESELGLSVFDTGKYYDFDADNRLNCYSVCFFGHAHKILGRWTNSFEGGSTELYYLASIGRPNHTEVSNNFLYRNIPSIILDLDMGEYLVEDNMIRLWDRELSVDEEKVKKAQLVYAENKQRKEIVRTAKHYGKPLDNIKTAIGDNVVLNEIIDKALLNKMAVCSEYIENKVEHLKGVY